MLNAGGGLFYVLVIVTYKHTKLDQGRLLVSTKTATDVMARIVLALGQYRGLFPNTTLLFKDSHLRVSAHPLRSRGDRKESARGTSECVISTRIRRPPQLGRIVAVVVRNGTDPVSVNAEDLSELRAP